MHTILRKSLSLCVSLSLSLCLYLCLSLSVSVSLSLSLSRPTQPQERQSYVRGLVVSCSEGRGRRLDRERAWRRWHTWTAQCTVHATDGEMQQQCHKAVDGRGRRNWPSHYQDSYQSFDHRLRYHQQPYPHQPYSHQPYPHQPYPYQPYLYQPYPPPPYPHQARPLTPSRRGAADVPPVPVSPDQPWWPYLSVMHCDYPWGQRDNARHSPYQNRVSSGL